MSSAPLLPHAGAWKDAQGRPLPVEFFRFLSDLQRFVRDAGGAGVVGLEELAARVAALEEGEQTSIRGIGSVRVQDGVVQLLGDVDNPSGSQVYGSNPAGERGWWNIVDAVTVGTGLTKTASDDGYNLLGELDDVSDLPGSASVDDAYLIDGNYWVWGGSDWTNVGPPSNTAELAVYPGTNKDDGLLWNPSLPTPDFEVAPVVRNPMTTAGDLIYRGSGGAPVRLGIGSNGDRLVVASGIPAWETPAYGNLVAGSNVTLSGTLTGRLVGSGNVTISATGGGGGGGGWTLINDWSFAADGAVSEVVGNVSGYSEVIAVVRSVGMSVSGRRMFAVSTNGGSTWHTTYAAISTAGVETAATDVPMHLTDASAARSSYVRVALFPSGDTVTIDRPVNNTFAAFAAALPGVVNAVRVYPNSGTFTSGAVEIWAR